MNCSNVIAQSKERKRNVAMFFRGIAESPLPLVLVGAPVQGCSSLLIYARIKCSLRADSLTLRHGDSSTTAHNMTWVIHKLHRMIIKLPTTKPSR